MTASTTADASASGSADRRRAAVGAMWTGLACLALAGLTVTDTSGDVGLVPVLAWLQVLPCLAGLVTVVLLWRQPR